jgi:hypothetical protein
MVSLHTSQGNLYGLSVELYLLGLLVTGHAGSDPAARRGLRSRRQTEKQPAPGVVPL